MEEYGYKDYGWVLKNPRMIKPVPVKGKLNLWNYDGPIEIIPDEEWCVTEDASEEEAEARWASFVKKYWEPLMSNSSKKQETRKPEETEKEVVQEKDETLHEKKVEKNQRQIFNMKS